MNTTPVEKVSVVIIGGGIGGAKIARALSKILDPTLHTLTLVSARKTYVYLPASLRALVDPGYPLSAVFMSYATVFGDFPGNLIFGTVTSIEENTRALSNYEPGQLCSGNVIYRPNECDGEEKDEKPERLRYDLLVMATGSKWEGFTGFPSDTKNCIKHIETWRIKFKEANDIVIAGGGAVGLETAGELKDIYPDKNVTIVHGDRLPLNEVYPDRYRTLVERGLRSRGVKFVFNDIIIGNPPVSKTSPLLKTRNGMSITCDLLVPARGGRPSTLPLSFLSPSPLSSRGFVKVQPTLQLQHHPNIFAVGDIVDWPEIRQLIKIYGHASVVVDGVSRMLRGLKPRKKYKGVGEVILVTNGKDGGASYCGFPPPFDGGFTLGDFWTRTLKSRTLLVNKSRKGLGLEHLEGF